MQPQRREGAKKIANVIFSSR